MAKYRKLPVVIEAQQFLPNDLDIDELKKHCEKLHIEITGLRTKEEMVEAGKQLCLIQYIINTIEGPMYCSSGDWIITGVAGERYPCKPDIFEKTYELVEETTCDCCGRDGPLSAHND